MGAKLQADVIVAEDPAGIAAVEPVVDLGAAAAIITPSEPLWFERLKAVGPTASAMMVITTGRDLGALLLAVDALRACDRLLLLFFDLSVDVDAIRTLLDTGHGTWPTYEVRRIIVDGTLTISVVELNRHGRPRTNGASELLLLRALLPETKLRYAPLPLWGLRVGFVGAGGLAWLGGSPRAVVVTSEWVGALGERLDDHLDVLVVDAYPDGWRSSGVATVISEARELGAAIIGYHDAPRPLWQGRVDIEVGPLTTTTVTQPMRALQPVDVRSVNPIGYHRESTDAVAALVSHEAPNLTTLAGTITGTSTIDVLTPSDLHLAAGADSFPDHIRIVPRPSDVTRLVQSLRRHRVVVDHPVMHTNPVIRAQDVTVLAAAGVPLRVHHPQDLRTLLGDPLTQALQATHDTDFTDPDERERASVIQRRAALAHHAVRARWTQLLPDLSIPAPQPTSVSIILATNRQAFLPHAIEQINNQRYEQRETIIVLHGDTFPPDTEDWIHKHHHDSCHIVRAPKYLTLGDALNLGVERASGDLITKMDDDDWYGPDHLLDLVLAMQYSNAHLVGKAAEFVYLANLDITIRRFTTGAETPSRTLAGGTVTIRRQDLIDAGWWRRVPRSVDRHLIDTIVGLGQRLHRTHPFGYVLNRHGSGHTWGIETEYFLESSRSQWRGLAIREADARQPVR